MKAVDRKTCRKEIIKFLKIACRGRRKIMIKRKTMYKLMDDKYHNKSGKYVFYNTMRTLASEGKVNTRRYEVGL